MNPHRWIVEVAYPGDPWHLNSTEASPMADLAEQCGLPVGGGYTLPRGQNAGADPPFADECSHEFFEALSLTDARRFIAEVRQWEAVSPAPIVARVVARR